MRTVIPKICSLLAFGVQLGDIACLSLSIAQAPSSFIFDQVSRTRTSSSRSQLRPRTTVTSLCLQNSLFGRSVSDESDDGDEQNGLHGHASSFQVNYSNNATMEPPPKNVISTGDSMNVNGIQDASKKPPLKDSIDSLFHMSNLGLIHK